MVIHVTVIRNLPFKSHGVCTIKYGAICNGRFVQTPPPSFELYPLPYFFLLVNDYSGFSILIAPENVQPKSSCGLCFVHVSRKTFFSGLLFLYSNKECGETENLILLLYGKGSHKEHPILLSSTAFNAFKEGRPFEPF